MERKVTIKQRILDKTWKDEKGATLRMTSVHSNTSGEKDFTVQAEIELISPAETPFRKDAVRTVVTIPGEDTSAFEESAGSIVKIVQARNVYTPTSPRPYVELSTPFVDGVTIGSSKEPAKPTVYFFEFHNNAVPIRFLIGDQDQLEEFRYFFRQVNEYHQSICQQRAA